MEGEEHMDVEEWYSIDHQSYKFDRTHVVAINDVHSILLQNFIVWHTDGNGNPCSLKHCAVFPQDGLEPGRRTACPSCALLEIKKNDFFEWSIPVLLDQLLVCL